MKIVLTLEDVILVIFFLIWAIWVCVYIVPVLIKQWWNNRKKKVSK